MTTAERMTEMAQTQAADILGEPVLGVAFANRCGTLGAIIAGTLREIATSGWDHPLNGGAYVPKDDIRRGGTALASLPPAFLLAVTVGQVHVFKIRMVMGRVKLKDSLAAFDRAGLDIATHEDTLVRLFAIRAPGQDQDMAFEIMKSDYATDFAGLLRG